MSWTKIADVVIGLPFGSEGKKRWRTVGALLRDSENDMTKGPGFVISLESTFNPAGGVIHEGNVMLSCFHPKEREPMKPEAPMRRKPPKDSFDDIPADDVPF